MPELEVQGVGNGDARALLSSAVRFKLDEASGTGSSPRRGGIRSRCSSCRMG